MTDGLCEAAGELFSLSPSLFRWYSEGAHPEMLEDAGRNSIKVHWTQCALSAMWLRKLCDLYHRGGAEGAD